MGISFDEKDFTSQISAVLKDVAELTNPVLTSQNVNSTTIDNKKKGPFLVDSSYGISDPLNLSEIPLTDLEINNIAEDAYNTNRSKSVDYDAYVNNLNKEKQADIDAYYNTDDANDLIYGISSTLSKIDSILTKGSNLVTSYAEAFNDVKQDTITSLREISSYIPSSNTFFQTVKSIFAVLGDGASDYKDGISETNFGYRMEDSWQGSGVRSFLNYFANQNANLTRESKTIKFLSSTPLDAGSERQALYGSLMMGAPYLFNSYSDPRNRTLINTFIKDGKFLSLTPGMPKYNGTTYMAKDINNQLMQTTSPQSMLNYLLRNGLDAEFSNKDKRYYTFKASYEEYFSYLETMLNAIWVKLGLASNGDTFNLFTFFNLSNDNNGSITPANYKSLKSQYNSSIGFFANPAGTITESIDSSTTGFGSDLASRANSNSDVFQQLNYMTGMGTGGALRNIGRTFSVMSKGFNMFRQTIGDNFGTTQSTLSDIRDSTSKLKWVTGLPKLIGSAIVDVSNFSSENDLGAIIQSFATSNGMKVVYPELWSDSTYSRSASFNFTFTSPYGDPLSVFKYVYVPFCALACFAMPRQTADNGYVSPFFVRADMPGIITSDLAMITSFTWTRGGSNYRFTKDGLPLSIDCSIQIQDLYPYLSMTKRLSFLSANPSYAVFLNSLTGMMALNDVSDDALNSYFKEMINRVNGVEAKGNRLWNKFNTIKSKETEAISNDVRMSISKSVDINAVPWLHNSSQN